jgi:predicted dehydrogenase
MKVPVVASAARSEKPIRVVVIGVGYMGARHAVKVKYLEERDENVLLVGVADRDAARARSIASALDTIAVVDYRELLPIADAAIVAVPTLQHFDVVRNVLRAGLDVLVEKPLAPTLQQAETLCCEADDYRKILQVGHLEWFNPALLAVREFVNAPQFIEVCRTSFLPPTCDIDVVHDLMIHDLHIVHHLMRQEPTEISATGICVTRDTIDIAHACLEFPNGCVTHLTANRASPIRVRRYQIYQDDMVLVVDFLNQSSLAYRHINGSSVSQRYQANERAQGNQPDVLLLQLQGFLEAIQSGDAGAVAGLGVLSTLRTAHRIVEDICSLKPDGRVISEIGIL